MALLVLAYPQLSIVDHQRIQDYRRLHDELYYTVVDPHFTFVFPVDNMDVDSFIRDVESKFLGEHEIHFVLRCAVVNKDAFLDYYHTFLVPEEGFSKIVRLHDKLYSGLLQPHLRLDIDFIPHMGIANSKDSAQCKKMADEWNQGEFAIPGLIRQLNIVRFENNVVSHVRIIPLLHE